MTRVKSFLLWESALLLIGCGTYWFVVARSSSDTSPMARTWPVREPSSITYNSEKTAAMRQLDILYRWRISVLDGAEG
jgi:hypothetical protein